MNCRNRWRRSPFLAANHCVGLGAALAGAILGPLGLGTARAGPPDPCKAFCHCRNRQQQNACLAACHTCNGDTSRLCGTCGTYVCCDQPDPYENGAVR